MEDTNTASVETEIEEDPVEDDQGVMTDKEALEALWEQMTMITQQVSELIGAVNGLIEDSSEHDGHLGALDAELITISGNLNTLTVGLLTGGQSKTPEPSRHHPSGKGNKGRNQFASVPAVPRIPG